MSIFFNIILIIIIIPICIITFVRYYFNYQQNSIAKWMRMTRKQRIKKDNKDKIDIMNRKRDLIDQIRKEYNSIQSREK